MSVITNLALLSMYLLFNLISSRTMQIEANLRAQGGSRRCSHGSASMINFDKIHRMTESRKPCSISSGNNEKKEEKKRQKPFYTVRNDEVHTDFLISLFRLVIHDSFHTHSSTKVTQSILSSRERSDMTVIPNISLTNS